MGMLVVAEGVENPQERDAVRGAGCQLLQGYLFAKPGPPYPVVETIG
jgi:EAL domain-containing protein (putative c-di-GMP-specific phosphodiesterase class I)